MEGPLAGLKVLDLTRLLPGAQCTLILADYGADVLKVEEPQQGDYLRWYEPRNVKESPLFLGLNRNKRSMTLNLKHPEGKKIFRSLVKEYDILIEGFRPGVMERLGLSYSSLAQINPRLIYCALTGFGQDGPYVNRVGHDVNYIGIGGILSITGPRNGPPIIPGAQIGDVGGGALMAVIGILMAVIARERSGKGQFVDVSMLDGILSWLSMIGSQFLADGKVPGREEMMLNGRYLCYRIYETKDGRHLTIGALEPKFWANLCKVLGKEHLIRHQFTDGDEQVPLARELEETFKQKDLSEWLELLEGIDICHGPVNSLKEAFEDPQARHRQMVIEVDHPVEGKLRQVGFPIKLSLNKPKVRKAPPIFGQHTSEVLESLGFDEEKIEDLRKRGIV
ncbi:MAG TPA: CoA transferase [Desulfobacterales bacterium]|nr:CoA transferase [Desulfobacterales bacterium]